MAPCLHQDQLRYFEAVDLHTDAHSVSRGGWTQTARFFGESRRERREVWNRERKYIRFNHRHTPLLPLGIVDHGDVVQGFMSTTTNLAIAVKYSADFNVERNLSYV
eukprot:SAG11_NODE_17633_length_513_cov_0.850242_2_plen_105_part_01